MMEELHQSLEVEVVGAPLEQHHQEHRRLALHPLLGNPTYSTTAPQLERDRERDRETETETEGDRERDRQREVGRK